MRAGYPSTRMCFSAAQVATTGGDEGMPAVRATRGTKVRVNQGTISGGHDGPAFYQEAASLTCRDKLQTAVCYGSNAPNRMVVDGRGSKVLIRSHCFHKPPDATFAFARRERVQRQEITQVILQGASPERGVHGRVFRIGRGEFTCRGTLSSFHPSGHFPRKERVQVWSCSLAAWDIVATHKRCLHNDASVNIDIQNQHLSPQHDCIRRRTARAVDKGLHAQSATPFREAVRRWWTSVRKGDTPVTRGKARCCRARYGDGGRDRGMLLHEAHKLRCLTGGGQRTQLRQGIAQLGGRVQYRL